MPFTSRKPRGFSYTVLFGSVAFPKALWMPLRKATISLLSPGSQWA